MNRRKALEKGIYWGIQTTIVLCVMLTTSFFFKTSLQSDDSHYQVVRNDSGHHQERENHSCVHPLILSRNRTCEPACDWSFTPLSEQKIYGLVTSVCLRVALVAMFLTLITWLACKPMRRFPHIVRFYILITSASFTMAGIFPSLLDAGDTSCVGGKYWTSEGMVSNRITLQGAVCHYFLLASCFWLLCYVLNTYLVLVLNKHLTFTYPGKLHVLQLVFCFVIPLMFIAVCLLVKQPGYNMLFKDRLAILPLSRTLVLGTIVLPVQLSSGAALCMLVSIIRCIRKVSRNPSTVSNVIRSDEEVALFKNVERHFLVIVSVYVLSMVLIFVAEAFLQDEEITYLRDIQTYFACLQTANSCAQPARPKFFLSSLKVLTPGFFCLLSFCLLFFNEETRAVWTKWFHVIRSRMSKCAKSVPPPRQRTIACQEEFDMRNTEPANRGSVVTLGMESTNSLNFILHVPASEANVTHVGT